MMPRPIFEADIMDGPESTGEEDFPDHIEIGRPRPESRALMTAKQLVYAYQEAPSDEDREYAAAEAESFLYSLGDDADAAVLLVLLQLPASDGARTVVEMVQERLSERIPGVIAGVLRAALEHDGPARANAAAFLDGLSAHTFAVGLIAALAGEADYSLRRSAAQSLVALGRSAASEILDALADEKVRAWIVRASGAPAAASDAEVMRSITAAPRADSR
jgi:hypothetical protein